MVSSTIGSYHLGLVRTQKKYQWLLLCWWMVAHPWPVSCKYVPHSWHWKFWLITYNFWNKSCSAMEVISFPTHFKYLNKLCSDLSHKRNGLNIVFSFSFVWLTISTVPHLSELCTLSLFQLADFHYSPSLLSHCLLLWCSLYGSSSQYRLSRLLASTGTLIKL